MWLRIPEGKPIWQIKILQRESHYQNNDQNKTIQNKWKDIASRISLAENANWLHFKTGKSFLKALQIWQLVKTIHLCEMIV